MPTRDAVREYLGCVLGWVEGVLGAVACVSVPQWLAQFGACSDQRQLARWLGGCVAASGWSILVVSRSQINVLLILLLSEIEYSSLVRCDCETREPGT